MTADRIIPKSFGIARKFILAIAIFSTILTLAGTCLQLYIDYRKDLRSISRQLSYIETSHIHSLINDIWLFNDRGLEAQLKGILALPMVEALRLERIDGPAMVVGTTKSKHLITHTIPLSYQHLDKEVPLGSLQITASTDHVIQRMQERVLLILLTQFVLVFCISAFIFFLFYQLIGRHLAVMARHASALTISTLHEPLKLERCENTQGSKDELDLLVDALNSMQAQISDYLKERRQIEDTLHEQAALLEDEIAQRQQTQEELNVINCSLEERISNAISELRQKDNLLLQQSKLAAMGELLSNIAHQWRQPLNALALVVANLEDAWAYHELDDALLHQSARKADQLIQSMSHTIDDFRNFFRPDKAAINFEITPVVHETLSLLGASLQHHAIKVVVDSSADVTAFGFPSQFTQVLLNLMGNARDAILNHAPVQGGVITLAWSSKADQLQLTVADNGGGIPEDILAKIFEPYFSTKPQGSGIGLYMSKLIIEHNMHGQLRAANQMDGAVFTILLPLDEPSE